MVTGYEGYTGIVSERGLVYKVVGEGLDPKTILFTSIMTKNILSIEKLHLVPKQVL